MLKRSLTIETKDKPHVVMYGMTRHVFEGRYEDREDTHYLPVTGYDDLSTIELNRKQLGWAVVGYGNLEQLADPATGRMRKDVVMLKNELDLLLNSPETKLTSDYEAKLRAEIEAKVRAEMAEAPKETKKEKHERAGRNEAKSEGDVHQEPARA